MDLYGKTSKSIPQKIIIHILEILLLYLSFWILFEEGGVWLENHLGISNAGNNIDRRKIIFVFNLVIFLRLSYMMIQAFRMTRRDWRAGAIACGSPRDLAERFNKRFGKTFVVPKPVILAGQGILQSNAMDEVRDVLVFCRSWAGARGASRAVAAGDGKIRPCSVSLPSASRTVCDISG